MLRSLLRLWGNVFKRDETEVAALENPQPDVRSAVRALAGTIQRMEREGKGPHDAPFTGLVEHSAALVTKDHQKDEDGGNGQQRTSLLILRQTALNLAIAAGRLDIVSLMVGPEDEGLGEIEEAEKEEEILCAATHLGWNPCFTTTDNYMVLCCGKRCLRISSIVLGVLALIFFAVTIYAWHAAVQAVDNAREERARMQSVGNDPEPLYIFEFNNAVKPWQPSEAMAPRRDEGTNFR